MSLFVDMDGVLADFDAGYERHLGVKLDRRAYVVDGVDRVNWKAVGLTRGFFLGIPPMPDMHQLWDGVAHLSPTILTSVPYSVPEAAANKIAWVNMHLGDVPVICVSGSSRKEEHCRPGDILIDDYPKYRDRWEKAGGVFIVHTSAETSLRELDLIGVWTRRCAAKESE